LPPEGADRGWDGMGWKMVSDKRKKRKTVNERWHVPGWGKKGSGGVQSPRHWGKCVVGW